MQIGYQYRSMTYWSYEKKHPAVNRHSKRTSVKMFEHVFSLIALDHNHEQHNRLIKGKDVLYRMIHQLYDDGQL